MAIGQLLKSIFSPAAPKEKSQEVAETLEYNGFTIEVAPIDEGGKFRTAGFISAEFEGELKRIQFIRADENADKQASIDHSLAKARQIIDEQGSSLLTKTHL